MDGAWFACARTDTPACRIWERTSSLMLDAMSASAMRLFAAEVFSHATASERVTLSRHYCIAPRFERFVLTVLIAASGAVMAAEAVAWVVMLLVSTASVAAVLFVTATARVSPLFAPICNVMDAVAPLGKFANELARRGVCHNTTDPDVRILVTTG